MLVAFSADGSLKIQSPATDRNTAILTTLPKGSYKKTQQNLETSQMSIISVIKSKHIDHEKS